jgi:FtsZ-interacting cell division protein ZipA
MTEEGMPTEEQLLEQIRQLTVDDVLLQTIVTLINLSGRKLTVEDEKDVGQAKKGIDAARALLPLAPEEQVAPIKEALSQLQMIYVREAKDEPSQEEADREEARSKLWTPPGT